MAKKSPKKLAADAKLCVTLPYPNLRERFKEGESNDTTLCADR